MPPGWETIALIAGGAGVLIGIILARRSHQALPLQSFVGHVFNYLASVAVAAVPLAVLSSLVLPGIRFRTGVTVALWTIAAAILLVLLHALPESMARRGQPQQSTNIFRLAWDRWEKISRPMGEFNSWLLMAVFYFTFMLPFGVLSRLLSDPLRLKKEPEGEPLWLTREQPADLTLDEARRQS